MKKNVPRPVCGESVDERPTYLSTEDRRYMGEKEWSPAVRMNMQKCVY